MESEAMKKKVLIVHAHPEPTSLTRQLVEVAVQTLQRQGHEVLQSDLYGMRWKAVFDEHDFPARADPERLSFIDESGHSYYSGRQAADIDAEQRKVLAADAVILQFPLWWYGMPAILKGWVDRVWAYGLAYGYKNAGNRYRFGDGAFKGKRALLSVAVGGPEEDYSPRGICGPLDQLLFPVTHGTLFFPGMEVLPTHAVYGTGRMTAESVAAAKASWHSRLERLFEEAPIPFRSQNGGSYPDGHVLARHVAVGQSGLPAHVEDVLVEGVPVEDVPVDDVTLQAPCAPISALDPATR
jgi:NAD(P)H dehydrogenase (quinone)